MARQWIGMLFFTLLLMSVTVSPRMPPTPQTVQLRRVVRAGRRR